MAGEEGTSAVISFCPQKTEDLGDKVGDGKTGARVMSLDSCPGSSYYTYLALTNDILKA